VQALAQIDGWGAEFAAAGVTDARAALAARGNARQPVRLASVSKPVTALALMVAVEEGVVELDAQAGPPGSTVRHLLSHASGLAFDDPTVLARPGQRRIYSNEGFRVVAAHLEERAGMPFAEYVRAAVCVPLGLGLAPEGHPGSGFHASLEDVLALGRELLEPTVISRETLAEMTTVQFPGLDGVLPDFGRFNPLDWGLGVELKGGKTPHWSGAVTSPETFGHFGGSGTFLWVDPARQVACAALTTRPFGDWAKAAWPRLSDAVLADLAG
jgi:CubicO group peptidase (beta-lactamase class C family)